MNRLTGSRGWSNIIAGASTLGLAAAAIAAGCYLDVGSLCSLHHSQPNDGYPDTFVIDHQITILSFEPPMEVPGRTGLDFKTCWVYVQERIMILGVCEDVGFPEGYIIPYVQPVGSLCDPS